MNHVTLQGRARVPTVRLSRDGPVFASVDVDLDDVARTSVTVAGFGLEAAAIASVEPGHVLRVEGTLTLDPETRDIYVVAEKASRMVERGFDLVAVPPSLAELDHLASAFAPHDT